MPLGPYEPGLKKFVNCACSTLEKDKEYSFNQAGTNCKMDRRTIHDYVHYHSNEVNTEMRKTCPPKTVKPTQICEKGLVVDPPNETDGTWKDLAICLAAAAVITSPVWMPSLIKRIRRS